MHPLLAATLALQLFLLLLQLSQLRPSVYHRRQGSWQHRSAAGPKLHMRCQYGRNCCCMLCCWRLCCLQLLGLAVELHDLCCQLLFEGWPPLRNNSCRICWGC
jgi:hypothetical protein